MTDAVQIALIVALGPVAATVLSHFLNDRKVERLATKVEDVHTLVNSQSTEQLRIGMISARALVAAKPTGENIELARIAEEKYNRAVAK